MAVPFFPLCPLCHWQSPYILSPLDIPSPSSLETRLAAACHFPCSVCIPSLPHSPTPPLSFATPLFYPLLLKPQLPLNLMPSAVPLLGASCCCHCLLVTGPCPCMASSLSSLLCSLPVEGSVCTDASPGTWCLHAGPLQPLQHPMPHFSEPPLVLESSVRTLI